MKNDHQKSFKKLTRCFLLHPVPFYGKDEEKQNISETSYHSLFKLQNMFRKIVFLVIYHQGYFDNLRANLSQRNRYFLRLLNFVILGKFVFCLLILEVKKSKKATKSWLYGLLEYLELFFFSLVSIGVMKYYDCEVTITKI